MKSYSKDIYRYYGRYDETLKQKIFRPTNLKYIIIFRKCENTKSKILKYFYRYKLHKLERKTLIQIPYNTKIGDGLYIGHLGRVIINPNAILGKNINIATGVTIGQENRGKRKGTPKIGDSVWIGANAVIVGDIKVGNDVLIAPLTYVNFDVPDHSIVIGSPGKIIHNDNATKYYINRKI